MIWIDQREGSALLLPHLLQHTPRVPAELTTLDYGDAYISGNGPGGGTLNVGIERKTVRDMLGSMRGGRLTHAKDRDREGQLIGMLQTYDISFVVIEGVYRAGADGVLEEYAGKTRGWQPLTLGGRTGRSSARFMHAELDRYIIQMQLHTAVAGKALLVRHTARVADTVVFLCNLHHQLTAKKWEEHKSWHSVRPPQPDVPFMLRPRTKEENNQIFKKRVAMCCDGIGDDRAAEIARHFASGRQIAGADVTELRKVKGVGKTLAQSMVDQWTYGE